MCTIPQSPSRISLAGYKWCEQNQLWLNISTLIKDTYYVSSATSLIIALT